MTIATKGNGTTLCAEVKELPNGATSCAKQRVAFITSTGQISTFLAEHLFAEGYYAVICSYQPNGLENPADALLSLELKNRFRPGLDLKQGGLSLVPGDITDPNFASSVLARFPEITEFYNLAGVTDPGEAKKHPKLAFDVNVLAVKCMLEAILKQRPDLRFFQASSIRAFREVDETKMPFPDSESPYSVTKAESQWLVDAYRCSGLYACSGIFSNQTSLMREMQFISRVISCGVARVKLGIQEVVDIRNISAEIDLGFAGDAARAAHLILNQPAQTPINMQDALVATGEIVTIEDIVRFACLAAFGEPASDKVVTNDGYEIYVGKQLVVKSPIIESKPMIPLIPTRLLELGWYPSKPLTRVIAEMVANDLELEEALLAG